MKATYSEEYFMKYWDEFMKPVSGGHYMNLEEELEHTLSPLKGVNIPEDKMEPVIKHYAGEIASNAKAKLMETMRMIQRIQRGEASLGYTTMNQEISEMHELTRRFEFNCLQLKVFRKAHNL